jgi:hypothetical protein
MSLVKKEDVVDITKILEKKTLFNALNLIEPLVDLFSVGKNCLPRCGSSRYESYLFQVGDLFQIAITSHLVNRFSVLEEGTVATLHLFDMDPLFITMESRWVELTADGTAVYMKRRGVPGQWGMLLDVAQGAGLRLGDWAG